MQLNHTIEIDILKLFQTGTFDFIQIGKTKEWILNNFPPPDDYARGDNLENSEIWRYGTIEFYFTGDILWQVYTDYLDPIHAGKHFKIKKWILEDPYLLSLDFVCQNLNKERINYQIKHTTKNNFYQVSIRLIHASLKLIFQPEETQVDDQRQWKEKLIPTISPNDYKLVAMVLMDKEEIKRAFQSG